MVWEDISPTAHQWWRFPSTRCARTLHPRCPKVEVAPNFVALSWYGRLQSTRIDRWHQQAQVSRRMAATGRLRVAHPQMPTAGMRLVSCGLHHRALVIRPWEEARW